MLNLNFLPFSPICHFLGRADVLNNFEPALCLSDANSGHILFCFMSLFKRSIHLSLGLHLGRDPSI